MSISIENEEAEQLVADLGRRTGQGATDLLLGLLRREKARVESERDKRVATAIADTDEIRQRWLSRPLIDPRSIDEILSYDQNGLPT